MQKISIIFFITYIVISINFTIARTALGEDVTGKCYDIHDPHESFNRAVFKFNVVVFRTLVYPPMVVYNNATPKWVQARVNGAFDNLRLPKTLVNNILQKDRTSASNTIGRFLTNTIFGLGGLFDVASKFDIPKETQSFEDTLAHYGMSYGSYSVSPFFGPSTTRGTVGMVVDFFTDPVHWALYGVFNQFYVVPTYDILVGVNKVSRYHDVIKEYIRTSVDSYATIRGTYIQHLSSKNPHCANVQAVNYSLDE